MLPCIPLTMLLMWLLILGLACQPASAASAACGAAASKQRHAVLAQQLSSNNSRSAHAVFPQVDAWSSSSSSRAAWNPASLRRSSSSSSGAPTVSTQAGSYSRHLLSQWRLLGFRGSRLVSGGVLQQLLSAADSNNEEAAAAAKDAASSQGRASRLLLRDLQLEGSGSSAVKRTATGSGSSGDRAASRFLATAAQGPTDTASQALLPVGGDAQPLCSATINYGASVGDASKKATADVPIYVGSFDIVVTQPQVGFEQSSGGGGRAVMHVGNMVEGLKPPAVDKAAWGEASTREDYDRVVNDRSISDSMLAPCSMCSKSTSRLRVHDAAV